MVNLSFHCQFESRVFIAKGVKVSVSKEVRFMVMAVKLAIALIIG